MRRSNVGYHRASHKKRLRKRLGIETLEPKRVLDASFGFVDVPGGFAFEIMGTDYKTSDATKLAIADNIVLWTDQTSFATNFFVEWNDNGGTWGSISGTVTAGDIANEATARNRSPGDFKGFFVKGLDGDDFITANGEVPRSFDLNNDCNVTSTKLYKFDDVLGHDIGILPGAPSTIKNTDVKFPLLGQRLTADGNAGQDTITGSPEDDDLAGGADQDIIIGEAGNDNIQGNAGCDRIWGDGDSQSDYKDLGVDRTGNDSDTGDDAIKGDADRDRIKAGPGSDMVEGGSGNDDIEGGPGDDTLLGDGDKDNLDGGAGSDRMDGGDGNDALLGDPDDKEDQEGGTGTDAWQRGDTGDKAKGIKIASSTLEKVDTTGSDDDLNPDKIKDGYFEQNQNGRFPQAANYPFDAPDKVDLRGWTDDSVIGVEIVTGDGNDVLIGADGGKDRLWGGAGNDKLVSGGLNDEIYGGDGDDFISGGPGADLIDGGGPQRVGESRGSDAPYFDMLSYGAVTIDGEVVDDGSDAAVQVSLEGLLDDYNDPQGDVVGTAPEKDEVGNNGNNFGRGGDADGDRIFDADGHGGDYINEGKSQSGNAVRRRDGIRDMSIEGLIGSDFDDVLEGDVSGNELNGGKGNDRLFGFEADDAMDGGDGDDVVLGSGGFDTIRGGKNNDLLFGEGDRGEDDSPAPGKGGGDSAALKEVVQWGKDGEDTILGEGGDDLVDGGASTNADFLSGGKDIDRIRTEYDGSGSALYTAMIDSLIFGNEGTDVFEIRGTKDAQQEIRAMASLTAKTETQGEADFDNNLDSIVFGNFGSFLSSVPFAP